MHFIAATGRGMVHRRFFMVLVLLVVAFLVAFKSASGHQGGQAPDLSSLSDTDLKAVTISFERTRCYGSCPAYTVTIHGDGRIEYAGKDYVKVKGTQAGSMEASAVKALLSEFARVKFMSLPHYRSEKCSCRQCTDMPTVNTQIVAGSVTHRVEHYYGCGCAPKELFDLESAIDKAAKTEQWTGDVSKQGPFGTTCFG